MTIHRVKLCPSRYALCAVGLTSLSYLIAPEAAAIAIVDGFDSPIGTGSEWFIAQDWAEVSTVPSVKGLLHPGEDWNKAPQGSDIGKPVYAVANGEVVYQRYVSVSNQSMIVLKHTLLPTGLPFDHYLYSMYLHTDPLSTLKAGDMVERNQKIATIADLPDGTSGDVSHLHFEMRDVPIQEGNEWPNSEGRAYYADLAAMTKDGLSFKPSDVIASNRGMDWLFLPGIQREQTVNASPPLVTIGIGGLLGADPTAGLTVNGAKLNTEEIMVGFDTEAFLKIKNGSEVTVSAASVGGYRYGSVEVSGPGSVLRGAVELGKVMEIGAPPGNGSLRVTGGGKVFGDLSIHGGGATFEGMGTELVGSSLVIEDGGSSSILGFTRGLHISDGATVRIKGGASNVIGGSDETARGDVFVSGASTRLLIDGSLEIWNGSLNVSDGARVEVDHAMVGMRSYGSGSMRIESGATLQAASVLIGPEGTLLGSGNVIGSVTSLGGLVSPGSSPGTLSIEGDFWMASGQLWIELAGLGAGDFDVLDVSGFVNLLGGEIVFEFIDGFLPSAGDLFQFIVAGAGLYISDDVNYSYRGLPYGYQLAVDGTNGALYVVASAVAEPATFTLFGLGLAGLGAVRRKKLAA